MQAAVRRLPIVRSAQPPDRLTGRDDLTGRHNWQNGFVLGADAVAVRDHDDASPGDSAGEGHPAGGRGENERPRRGAEIDAAMPGRVRRRGRFEPAQDDDRAGQRYAKSRDGGFCDGRRGGQPIRTDRRDEGPSRAGE